MCLNAKTYRNPTLYFEAGRSPLNIVASCGQCDECQMVSRNEWFFRNYAEWKYTKEHGGKTFFLTLTYAEEELPYYFQRYNCMDQDGTICEKLTSFPCFSLEDIQVFIMKMRKYAQRRFGSDTRIRYMVFPEYGSKTKRPHYHVFFYVNKQLSNFQFFQLVDGYDNDAIRRKAWRWPKDKLFFKTKKHPYGYRLRGAWTKGLIIVSKKSKGGMNVNTEKSIKYASKYAVKDINYYKLPVIEEFLSCVKDSRLHDDVTRRKILSSFDRVTCKHRQSTKLGYIWLMRQVLNDPKHTLQYGFTLDIDCNRTSATSYFLPQYYKRKLFNKYSVRVLPDGRKQVHWFHRYSSRNKILFELNAKIDNYVSKCKEHITNLVGRKFSFDDLKKLGGIFGSTQELYLFLSSFYTSNQLRNISIYKHVFANRSAYVDILDGSYYKENVHLYVDNFVNRYEQYYMQFIDNRHSPFSGEPLLKTSFFNHFKFPYNTFDCFKGYDYFIEIMDKLFSFWNSLKLEYGQYKQAYKDRMSDNDLTFRYADIMEFTYQSPCPDAVGIRKRCAHA